MPEAILIATGSEVGLAVDAAKELERQGRRVRVVSMPATNIFDQQDKAYQVAVLPPQVTARVAIEAAAKDFWYKYVGQQGAILGMTGFGESAPANDLFKAFGFTVETVVQLVQETIKTTMQPNNVIEV